MKKLLLLTSLTILLFSCGEEKKEEPKVKQTITVTQESIEDKIINSLSESDKKDLFLSILNIQDRAEKYAKTLVPNDNDFNKRIDASRKYQDKYELELYEKQSWWGDINKDKSIANKIKLKISSLGISSNWLN